MLDRGQTVVKQSGLKFQSGTTPCVSNRPVEPVIEGSYRTRVLAVPNLTFSFLFGQLQVVTA
eukprot:1209689-Rhodomonas_salina.4